MIQHDRTTENGPLLMEWTQPSSHMILTRGKTGVVERAHTLIVRKKGETLMHITTLGIDVAKNIFQLRGVDA